MINLGFALEHLNLDLSFNIVSVLIILRIFSKSYQEYRGFVGLTRPVPNSCHLSALHFAEHHIYVARGT